MPVDEEAIFHAARALPTGEVQHAFVAQACGGNSALLRRVQSLLQIYRASVATSDTLVSDLLDTKNRDLRRPEFPQLESYEILEQLGEGGFGYVFRAQQTKPLRRQVAIKLLKPGMDSREVLARFEAERQALAVMSHAGIAGVFDAGTTADGRPYFVMELVEGRPITDYCDQARLSLKQRLELFATVCQAVQHAHQRGIIHRDLKPGNVLVAQHDDKAVAKVIDFGIAKAISQPLGDQSIHTRAMQLIGTPLYMSPEQAEAGALDIDTRSDVYSLGVLLYELLTGTTPFDKEMLRAAGDFGMRRIIREEEPLAPSQKVSSLNIDRRKLAAQQRSVDERRLRQALRGELDWIVLKALEKERDRRYESVSALAADVQRHLSNEPVAASPPSSWYRAKKYAVRNVYRIGVVAIVLSALASLVGAGIWHRWRVWEYQIQVKSDALNSYVASMQIGDRLRHDGNYQRLATLLNDRRPQWGDEDLRGFEWHFLWHSTAVLREPTGTGSNLDFVELSPNGQVLATGSNKGEICFWDFDSLEKLSELPGQAGPFDAGKFSADGKRFLVSSPTELFVEAKAWDYRSGTLKNHRKWNVFTKTGVIHPKGLFVVGTVGPQTQGYLQTWDPRTKRTVTTTIWERPGRRVSDISSASQGLLLAIGHHRVDGAQQPEDGAPGWAIDVIDQTTRRMFLELPRRFDKPVRTALSPADDFLAFAEEGSPVEIWNLKTRQQHLVLKESHAYLTDFEFSPDGKTLAMVGREPRIRNDSVSLWDVQSGMKKSEWRIGQRSRTLAFAPDSKTVLIGGEYKAQMWQLLPDPPETAVSPPEPLEVWGVGFLPRTNAIVSAGDDHCLRTWGLDGAPQSWATAHGSLVSCIAIDSTNSRIATGSYDDEVRLWRSEDLEPLRTLSGHSEDVRCVAFSSDGSLLASGGRDDVVRLWNPETGDQVATLPGHTNQVRGLAFWSNGRLISASEDEQIRIWETDSRRCIKELDTTSPAWSVAIPPDARFFVTGHKDGLIRLWDGTNSNPSALLQGHSEGVLSLSFSPDGKTLASGSEDGSVRLWHVQTRQELLAFKELGGKVYSVSFDSDGQTLVAALGNGQIRLWRAPRS